MKITARILVGTVVAMVLSGCGKGRWEKEEVEIGYKGEARRNPFLAAERFADEAGFWSDSVRTLSEMPGPGGTMLLSAEAVRSSGQARQILNWVRGGGHGIFMLEGGDVMVNDWFEFVAEGEFSSEHPLLDALDVEIVDGEEYHGTIEIELDGLDFEVEFPSDEAFKLPPNRQASAVYHESPDATPFASFHLGSGRITLLASGHAFRNRYIDENDHAWFLFSILYLDDYRYDEDFWIVLATRTSFLSLLWKYGWMAIVALLLLVAFWIWKNMPRHGPVLPGEPAVSRQFTEHIDMTGRYLWSSRCMDALLGPLRRWIKVRFLKTHPSVRSDHESDIAPALAKRSDLPVKDAVEAMTGGEVRDGTELTRLVKNLQKMERSL